LSKKQMMCWRVISSLRTKLPPENSIENNMFASKAG
jgi:hypothetical protein